MKQILVFLFLCVTLGSCQNAKKAQIKDVKVPFIWEGANVYFLLTDRFNNGDKANDVNFNRTLETAKLRGFEGGDIKGVTAKINEGYFTDLGINAIWMTPVVEQIHGGTDEGTGMSYGFHGYWASDWTNLDPNFGTKADLHDMVEAAHKKGIRVLLDAVINHTGPVTENDAVWPDNWVRTSPKCDYNNFENTVTCTLVDNLPDVRTERNEAVELPLPLVEKWQKEGRYEQEMAELDAFFKRTGHPRAPRFYIMKWLTDYITEFGIDGYRVDTVKHTEPYVWQEFKMECDYAFEAFKKNNPSKVLNTQDFYLVGEVYNYSISAKKAFDFGDKKVNYFENSFNSLINFELKWNAAQLDLDSMFTKYSEILNSDLEGYGVLNYLSSHDDGQPFDPNREKPYEAGIKLLLCPGTSQVYYGDESARHLAIEGAEGDARLRSFMNWEAIQNDDETKNILNHWQKLGRFRVNHPAVGAGRHQMISKEPYLFSRRYSKAGYNDLVVVGLDLASGKKYLDVSTVFEEGDTLFDAYSGTQTEVKNGMVSIDSAYDIVLLSKII
ncbi:alpha-amylase family glycosyl hydrolase [Algibacter mikhailovii]|uniref:Glycosyl hydrolase family 13 catalytic domain-containing protein n=1 Tax=Algibacter mikhailovii TaxID=425498 RepID=A0A918R3E0_9FLAO|nr:alpha-amylase family glycosyl hydrolase [Algibacter mikhailovii]GGZ80112.1 hypothetical protein GCM10007028_17150 [Algibacter mikhailovii]